MAIKTVTLLGADGRLGPTVLSALLASKFKIQILKREGSKSISNYPAGVTEVRIPNDLPPSALESALKGQDAVVVTIPGNQINLQKKLADAAVKVGVSRFIPADFGSVDSGSQRARLWVPLYIDKYELHQYLQLLAEKNDTFSWTALVCGHFFDYDPLFLHIDVKGRKAEILDAGDIPASACTMSRIGEATAKLLEKASDPRTKNTTLYIQSFSATQNEIVKAFEKATGVKFEITKIEGMKFAEEKMKEMKAGDAAAREDVVWVLGAYEADWREKEGYANEWLGLEEESLDDISKAIARDGSKGSIN